MTTAQSNCDVVLDLIDSYMDGELGPRDTAAVTSHLRECDACTGTLAARQAVRGRIRGAAKNVETPRGLVNRIQEGLDSERRSMRPGWAPLAIAAGILLAVGSAISYQSGHLRLTPGSQNAYIADIAPRISPVMQVGLKDHVHCAVFRTYPARQPELPQLVTNLGPKYADLLPVMAQHIPAEFQLVMAHLCRYQGRQYVHLVARNGGRLVSLMITDRGAGEAFETGLRAVANEAGMPIYASGVQRFSLAGFETAGHLVYVVSDLDESQNLALLEAMTPQLRDALRRLES